MTTEALGWQRPQFEPNGGNPYLHFVVYGELPRELTLSPARHRADKVPAGLHLSRFDPGDQEFDSYLDGFPGRWLRQQHPALEAPVRNSTSCIVLHGTPQDDRTLDYLRGAVGIVTAMLDQGGRAALDLQILRWLNAEEWRGEIFHSDEPNPHRHVTIFRTPEEGRPEVVWLHTRGMRKFGRPDLSVHEVLPEDCGAVIELLNRFIALQALGAVIREGAEIRMDGLPEGMTCRHRGDLGNPDFNNVHIEIF